MMKLLIVDDEEPTVAFLRRGLSEEGFAVDVALDADRRRGVSAIRTTGPSDLIAGTACRKPGSSWPSCFSADPIPIRERVPPMHVSARY